RFREGLAGDAPGASPAGDALLRSFGGLLAELFCLLLGALSGRLSEAPHELRALGGCDRAGGAQGSRGQQLLVVLQRGGDRLACVAVSVLFVLGHVDLLRPSRIHRENGRRGLRGTPLSSQPVPAPAVTEEVAALSVADGGYRRVELAPEL